jgi:hypothetical protein
MYVGDVVWSVYVTVEKRLYLLSFFDEILGTILIHRKYFLA